MNVTDEEGGLGSSLPVIASAQAKQSPQNENQLTSFQQNQARSRSVADFSLKRKRVDADDKSLNERKQSVIQYIKHIDNLQISAVLDHSDEELQGHQYYHLFQNPILAKMKNESRSQSVLDPSRRELSYNNKETIVPAFPLRRIEIRKPKAEDDEIEHRIFDSKLKKIVSDSKNYQSYKYTDG